LSSLGRLNVKLWADGNRLCYSAPQGTLPPAWRTALTQHKSEILTFLRQAYPTSSCTVSASSMPVSRRDNLPLTFAQQGFWFLDQLWPGSFAYNIHRAFYLTGQLDVVTLEQSLHELVQRHEILRTTFLSVDGQPVQVISLDPTLMWSIEGLRHLPETHWTLEAQRLAIAEAQYAFDLAQGPLLRVKLLRFADREQVLLLTVHHIIFDGWSLALFFRELAPLYAVFSTGKPSPLPTLPMQYADVAYWQRQHLQGDVLESLLTYWRQQLAGNPPVLQ